MVTGVRAIIAEHSALTPHRTAIRTGDNETITYGELSARVEAARNRLCSLGVESGNRVAALGRNDPSHLILLFACEALGAVLVLLNWRLTPDELHRIVLDAAPSVLMIAGSSRASASRFDGQRDFVLVVSDSEDLLSSSAKTSRSDGSGAKVHSAASDLMLCYTSGSSGRPKGVRLTDQNFVAAWHQAREQADWRWNRTSVSLSALPLFHIAGLRAALFPLMFGGTSVFAVDTQPATVIRAIAAEHVTKLSAVPTLLASMLDDRQFQPSLVAPLETIFYGGAPMPAVLLDKLKRQIPCDLVQIYGLTETTGAALALGPRDHITGSTRLRSCGKPLTGIDLRLVDADAQTGADVSLRGATVCAGYWRREDETQYSFNDGWFRTGDLGHVDADGYLFLHGRAGDVIKSGGEKVIPAEVEDAMMQHPAISEAGVVGVSDVKWGEVVAAAIVLREGWCLDEAQVMEHCRSLLAGYKLPRRLKFVQALPRNANGKLVRAELRDLLQQPTQVQQNEQPSTQP